MVDFNNFDALQIGLASPDKIREWSRGEVKKPETINYRSLKPERDGLFCERIFGPVKDWECHCGKYKRIRYKGVVCDRCGVEVTRSKVRRERMGHIELAAPVSHIWYFKGIPSRIGLYLDMTPKNLEKVLYFAAYVVIDPNKAREFDKYQVISEKEHREAVEKYGKDGFRAGMGAEAIQELIEEIDIDELAKSLREEYEATTGQRKIKAMRRLEVVESFIFGGNRPEWMIMDVIPVIPPDIRPMVQLDGGRFATSDLNDLYRRVINRNNRLKRLLDLGAPEIIVRNEKRMLQEAVDALIDNGRRGRPVTGPNNRPLKSLSDMLKGKQGRFRQNLLGKRVDYSGRSVIVVGPELKMHQCGLPKEMALELFKPFVMKSLVDEGHANNIKSAKRMVEKQAVQVWDVLEEIIKDHPVLLNRAPTLHRLGIQAFEPVLVEGRALKLHPLVCTAYNADFDGDQMAVHVPISVEAQSEARFLMLAANNLLKPQDGKPVAVPTQDMVLGTYYLTLLDEKAKGSGNVYSSVDEAMLAYDAGEVDIHAPIKVRMEREWNGTIISAIIDATIGRLIFNEILPQDLGFVDRTIKHKTAETLTKEEKQTLLGLEIQVVVDKKMLGKIVDKCIRVHGISEASLMSDDLKRLGYKYSTKGAITVSVSDMEVPEAKKTLIKEAEETVKEITRQFRKGLLTDDERYKLVIETWAKTKDDVTDALMKTLKVDNPIYMMAQSGARGSVAQISQLAGMRGLMANTQGETMEIPVRANFREGLNVLEYFISTHGARKGLADTALRTADSGYLTRRLVDVAQDVIIREEDCGTERFIVAREVRDNNEVIEELYERLVGRFPHEEIVDPATGEVIVEKGQLISAALAQKIVDCGITTVKVRSPLTCNAKHGICAKCYGANLANGLEVSIGEAVGIIAAQSIGEPGTQLTMRTFHTGGVASADDITQGLPRVEELFEARKPKGLAIISEIDGTVSISENKKKHEVIVTNDEEGQSKSYFIPFGSRVKVREGQIVEAGQELTYGSVYPADILRVRGIEAVQNYLTREVQRVYRLQGVEINDRHIEVIVRQMMKKCTVEDGGDTNLRAGSVVDVAEVVKENAKLPEDAEKATYVPLVMGITKASLATDSFLSAASFQETTKVLTDAAIKGKIDPLLGLKENVIIGKLVPSGTGLSKYKNVEVETLVDEVWA